MTIRILAGASLALACALAPARAAEDAAITRLATCQDSWSDWSKTAPGKLKALGEHFRAGYAEKEGEAFFVPKKETSIAGLRVVQAFPGNVGMGVGFSLTVDAGYDRTRAVMERLLGKRLVKCEASDGMHSCELDIAPQRTFTLMAADNDKNHTLVGCYYYYEK
ncbi:MAG TPA: hypothetical protein VMU08_12705 [Rhizomicrobium sp.]|nr:hypothetical protein [Rhizomicrobium sp.]